MVKVIYGEYSQQVELADMTVADVREMFKSEFDLSDRAQANLNGQQLKKKLEAETELCDEDELCFEERSRRSLVMLGSLLLTLAITGGIFAYTALTDTVTIGVSAVSAEFADVSANNSVAYQTATIVGNVVGKIDAGVMFDVSKETNYSGDVELIVALANVDELIQEYKFWMMRLKLTDGSDTTLGWDTNNSTQVISLKNPSVVFSVDSANLSIPRYIHTIGGSYKTLSSSIWAGSGFDPMVSAGVAQAGAH